MRQDSVQKLACYKCCIENRQNNNYLIEIESLLSFNKDQFVLKNFPPGLRKSLQEQLNSLDIQSSKREELKQQIIQEFDYFQKNIIEALDQSKKELLNHIDIIEEKRLNCIDTYNKISSKQEIIDNIINLSTNLVELNTYLTNLINAKYLSRNKDSKQIQNVVKQFIRMKDQVDTQNIHNKLLTILENIKSTNMFKINLNLDDQQTQQIQKLNFNMNSLSLNQQDSKRITLNQNNNCIQSVDLNSKKNSKIRVNKNIPTQNKNKNHIIALKTQPPQQNIFLKFLQSSLEEMNNNILNIAQSIQTQRAEFDKIDPANQRNILGQIIYLKIKNLNIETNKKILTWLETTDVNVAAVKVQEFKSQVAMITGMLIDLEVFTINDIIEIVMDEKELVEGCEEAIQLILEKN